MIDTLEQADLSTENTFFVAANTVKPMQGYLNSFAFGIAPSGKIDLALALFNYNIELYPDESVVYSKLAYFHNSRKELRSALKLYQKAHDLKPEDWVKKAVDEIEKALSESGRKE